MSRFRATIVLLSLLLGPGCAIQPSAANASVEIGGQPHRAELETTGAKFTSGPFALAASGTPFIPSDKERKLEIVINRFLDSLFQIDAVNWLGIAVVIALLVFYNLETRSPLFIIAFAAACLMGAAYGYLIGSRTVLVAGLISGILAPQKFWHHVKANHRGLSKVEHLAVAWFVRTIAILAVTAGVFALLVDSPVSTGLPGLLDHSVAEAVPLVLVGIAYLAWLATERPPTVALIKQVLIATAFLLWGVSLLMPAGPWARFVGAVVIAIYVFDLVWLIEGNLRRTLRAQAANPPLNGSPENGQEKRWSGDAVGVYTEASRSSQPQKSRRAQPMEST